MSIFFDLLEMHIAERERYHNSETIYKQPYNISHELEMRERGTYPRSHSSAYDDEYEDDYHDDDEESRRSPYRTLYPSYGKKEEEEEEEYDDWDDVDDFLEEDTRMDVSDKALQEEEKEMTMQDTCYGYPFRYGDMIYFRKRDGSGYEDVFGHPYDRKLNRILTEEDIAAQKAKEEEEERIRNAPGYGYEDRVDLIGLFLRDGKPVPEGWLKGLYDVPEVYNEPIPDWLMKMHKEQGVPLPGNYAAKEKEEEERASDAEINAAFPDRDESGDSYQFN